MIPLELQARTFQFACDYVAFMGLEWYELVAWGLAALVTGVVGNFLVARGWGGRLAYWLCFALLLAVSAHLFFLNDLFREARQLEIEFGPPALAVVAEFVLTVIGWGILHTHVTWQHDSPVLRWMEEHSDDGGADN